MEIYSTFTGLLMDVYGLIKTLDPFADWIPDRGRGQASRMTGGGECPPTLPLSHGGVRV